MSRTIIHNHYHIAAGGVVNVYGAQQPPPLPPTPPASPVRAASPPPLAPPPVRAASKKRRNEAEDLQSQYQSTARIEHGKLAKKRAARAGELRRVKAVKMTAAEAAAGVVVQGLKQGSTVRLHFEPDVEIYTVHAVDEHQYDSHDLCHEKNALGKAPVVVEEDEEASVEEPAGGGGGARFLPQPQPPLGNELHTALHDTWAQKSRGDVLIKHVGNVSSDLYLDHIVIDKHYRGRKLASGLLRAAMAAAAARYPAEHNDTRAMTFGLKHLSLNAECAHHTYNKVAAECGFRLKCVVVYPWQNNYGEFFVHGRTARMLDYLYERAEQ